MKNYILLVTLTACSLSAKAQWTLGGNFSMYSQRLKSQSGTYKSQASYFSISVLPRIVYAVRPNQWLGLETGFFSSSSTIPNSPASQRIETVRLFSFSPLYRNIFKTSERFGIWLEGKAGGSFGASRADGEKDDNYTLLGASIRPGIIFYFNNHLSFEASFGSFGFTSLKVKDASGSSDNFRFSQLGFNLNNVNTPIETRLLEEPAPLSGFQIGVNWTF